MNNFQLKDISFVIPAPRELSSERFKQIVKRYLPKGNMLLCIADELYVVGFDGQPQFKMLQLDTVQPIISTIDASSSKHKVYVQKGPQNSFDTLASHLIPPQRVLLINGSWKYAFHNSPAYRTLMDNNIDIKFLSPFIDEAEAKIYERSHTTTVTLPASEAKLDEQAMLNLAANIATKSFDNSFQTGASLGRKIDSSYEFILAGFNQVIPYQTYALHHGNSRETHRSQPHDANHYDTIHAEMMILTEALKRQISIDNTTLFINLLPCPNCARTLSQTGISEIVYQLDHSDGYAKTLLEASGKMVRKAVQ